jgi:hypothetical protein
MKDNHNGWSLGFQWLIATSVGWVVGPVLPEIIWKLLPNIGGFSILDFILLFVPSGLVSVMQWLVLRQHSSRSGWWILANTITITVVFMPLFVLGNGVVIEPNLLWILLAVCGAIVGLVQWLMLGWKPRWGFVWLLASSIAWAIGWQLYFTLIPNYTLAYTVLGVVNGTLTGIVLTWKVQLETSST